MSRLKKTFEFVNKVKNPPNSPKKPFHVMNRDAMFYKGLKSQDILWTHKQKEAKTFDNPQQIKYLKKWKPEEKMEIIYKDEL